MEISNDIELMNILTWILWGCLLAILVPALLLGFTIILNKILLGKDPGTRTYDDIMEAQREKREALIEDEDRPPMLKVVKTIEPIDVNTCPGLDLANYDEQTERIVPVGFSLAHGYLA